MTITIPVWVLWTLASALSHMAVLVCARIYGESVGWSKGVEFGDERASMRWSRNHDGMKACRVAPLPEETEG